ncbi:MAG: transglutaminase family protein [Cyclobacteriaceae bacterium]|nr:transglutaminase family protein [Cyclobacteriaceae bacterium]
MSRFRIRHITRYVYESPVRDSANRIMLFPLRDDLQEIVQHSLNITGSPAIDIVEDYYGNRVGTFTHAHPHQELVIDSQLQVTTHERVLPTDSRPVQEQWQALKLLRRDLNYIDFLKQEQFAGLDEIQQKIAEEKVKAASPFVAARDLSAYVFENFTYQKGITTVETTLDEVWRLRSGVCQDFAHMLLVLLRLMDIPARYVSGYICPNKNGMRGEGATHAWVEAWIPDYGWLGLDPTNNCIANETHVRLAVGKNFSDCSPVKGTYRGTSNHTMEVSVIVAYEDGHTSSPAAEMTLQPTAPMSTTSVYNNSFRRHLEMQQQQQQQ